MNITYQGSGAETSWHIGVLRSPASVAAHRAEERGGKALLGWLLHEIKGFRFRV